MKILKSILKYFDLTNILLMINTSVIVFVLVSCSMFDLMVLEFKREMELHKYVWEQEIRELKSVVTNAIDSVTQNDKKQIKVDKNQQKEIRNLAQVLLELEQIIDKNDKEQLDLVKNIKNTIKNLKNQQTEIENKLEETKKIDLDNAEDIKQANLVIYNTAYGTQGSGSHIKIGDDYYVLTCMHMLRTKNDFIWSVDDSNTWRPLELVKVDRKNDLALFRIYMTEDLPYLEISEIFPKAGSEIVIIGNPSNYEDILTDGIISKITKNEYIFTNIVYFGNSGGSILYKGKIIGVVTQMEMTYNLKKDEKLFILMGAGPKLEIIQEFLKDIKEE